MLYDFVENIIERCIYMKVNGSRFVILVLYVDDILLATNDVAMLHDVKKFLCNNCEMKDMGKAYYVIGIEIFRDRSQGLLRLSKKGYINKLLERLIMDKCSVGIVPIHKGDKECPRNDLEREKVKYILYVLMVGSLMKKIIGKLKKEDLRYLQGTKDYIFTYRRSNNLEVIGYSNSNYVGCMDSRKSIFGYIFLLDGWAISWMSAKSFVIVTSTMEVEFVTCFEAIIQE
ncbi:hypothetical protein CR513_27381, partial [Mucuna pruriens]